MPNRWTSGQALPLLWAAGAATWATTTTTTSCCCCRRRCWLDDSCTRVERQLSSLELRDNGSYLGFGGGRCHWLGFCSRLLLLLLLLLLGLALLKEVLQAALHVIQGVWVLLCCRCCGGCTCFPCCCCTARVCVGTLGPSSSCGWQLVCGSCCWGVLAGHSPCSGCCRSSCCCVVPCSSIVLCIVLVPYGQKRGGERQQAQGREGLRGPVCGGKQTGCGKVCCLRLGLLL
jgi:hypothetical protein